MARRTFQQVKSRDPNYGGTFAENQGGGLESSRVEPTEASQAMDAPAQELEPVQPRPAPAPPQMDPGPVVAPRAQPAPLAPPAKPARVTARASSGRAYVPVRVRARADQVERIKATGLRPGDVLKAAWRKASSGYTVGPEFIEPEPVGRAGGVLYFNTTLIVDADALDALARQHDPLGVRGGWWLLRGQVEPRLWAAIEEVLAQVASSRAP